MSETHNAIYLVNSDNSGTEYGNTGGSGGAKVEAEYEVTPAQNNHASGTIIYFNQKFYKVTTAITAGDTITIGTNITNANLGTGTQVFVKNMPKGLIPADDVSYDNTTSGLSATRVQGAIDEINSKLSKKDFGTLVDLKSYTTYANAFECPNDGYVYLNLGAVGSLSASVFINNTINNTLYIFYANSSI